MYCIMGWLINKKLTNYSQLKKPTMLRLAFRLEWYVTFLPLCFFYSLRDFLLYFPLHVQLPAFCL